MLALRLFGNRNGERSCALSSHTHRPRRSLTFGASRSRQQTRHPVHRPPCSVVRAAAESVECQCAVALRVAVSNLTLKP